MKKIVGILFCFQLCVLVFYGVFLFSNESYHQLLAPGIEVEVSFGNDVDNFHQFVNALYETGQFITSPRALNIRGDTIHFYTTDVTLGGEVVLLSGRFPEYGTSEFIHSHETGDENQVGVIDDILPSYVLSVTHFSNPFNFMMDGSYFFQTGDYEIVQTFVDSVASYVIGITVFDDWLFETSIWDSLMFVLGASGVWEVSGLSIMFFLSMLLAMLQYGIQIVRKQIIFKLHGISIGSVLKNATVAAFFPLFIGGISAYIISVIYVHFMRFHLFLTEITLYFVILSGMFILFYLFFFNLFIYGCLRFSNQSGMIKGSKSYKIPQILNHVLKGVFLVMMLMSLPTTLDTMAALNVRLMGRSIWEGSEDIYRVHFGATGYWSVDTEMAITENVRKMYDYLTEYRGGFLMDGTQMNWIVEVGFLWLGDPEESPSLELSPLGYKIRTSPSFLELNPVQTVNGIAIEEQLIWNPYVKNILVPQSLQPDEEILSELYLEQFYFEKIELHNSYASELGEPFLETTIDELRLNIIYVDDNQCHFTFNAHLMQSTGGILCNPVTVVFNPDNAHGNILFVSFQHSVYFRYDGGMQAAFESILPAIERYNLRENIRFISPVYNEFVWVMQVLTRQLIRLTVLFFLLLISTIAVTYYLMASYFEANKYQLTVKRHFGYHAFKRNKRFIISFLSYTIPVIVISGLYLGGVVFLIGLIVLAIDILVVLAFERRLMNKSFAEIMKGER